jgi:Holliday junction resolvase
MSAKSKGVAVEHKYRKLRESEGWTVIRAPGSLGAADLILMRKHQGDLVLTEVVCSQVKANVGNAWMNFRPAERNLLHEMAHRIGATAELVHWPPHQPMTIYRPEEWP